MIRIQLSKKLISNSTTKPLRKPLLIIILLLAIHSLSLVWMPIELPNIRIATGIMLLIIIAYLFLLLYKLNETIISKLKDFEEGEFRYQKLFNSITDAVIVYSLNGELIDCNSSTIQLLGYTKEELKRFKPTYVIHPEYLNIFIRNQQKVRDGEVTLVESLYIRKDGSTVPVEISTHNFNVDGQKAVLSVVRDISERKKTQQVIQQQSDQLDALKRTTTEGLWILDMDGKLKAVNKAYCQMSGYTEDELLEFSIASLKAKANPIEIASHRQKIIEQGWDIFESQHRRKDGTVYDVLVSVQIDRNRNEFYGFIRDITEEKKAKELLEHINNRFSIAENIGNLGVWEWNIKTNEVFWSDNIFKIFGYRTNEILPSKSLFEKHIYPDDAQFVGEILNQAVQQSLSKYTLDLRIITKNGETRWLSNQAIVLLDNDGVPEKTIGVCLDVTEKVMLEQELKLKDDAIREQARLMDLVFTYSLDSIAILDKDYNFVRVTESYARARAQGVSDFIGKNHFEMCPSDFREEADDVKRGKYVYYKTDRPFVFADHPEWGVTYWDIGFVPILDTANEVELFLMTLRNVTERKRVEMLLAESEEKYRILSINSVDMISRHSADGKVVFVSPVSESLTGYKPSELIGKEGTFFIPVEEHTIVWNKITESLEKGNMYIVEHQIIRKDGSIIMVETKGNVRRDSEGNIFDIICNVRDVTERKTLEQDLELKENAIQNSLTGIALSGTDGLTTHVNKAFVRLWGYETEQEVLGRSVFEFWENPDEIIEIIESIKSSNSWTGERVAKRKDGSTFHCLISSNFLSDASDTVTHLMGSFFDVTEQRKHEEQIAISLKEKELLLREIHHRVKNNLQIISSLIYLQSLQIEDKSIADIFNKNLRRIKAMAMVHDYLYQSENLKSIDFKQYVMQLATTARDSVGISTIVNINVDTDQIILFEQATYIGLLITELLNNSFKHAFKRRIQGEISIMLTMENGSFLLTYADNGVGIPNIEKVLNGKSFGIKIIKTLAKQLNGTLEYSSKEGTQVKLIFPHSS